MSTADACWIAAVLIGSLLAGACSDSTDLGPAEVEVSSDCRNEVQLADYSFDDASDLPPLAWKGRRVSGELVEVDGQQATFRGDDGFEILLTRGSTNLSCALWPPDS